MKRSNHRIAEGKLRSSLFFAPARGEQAAWKGCFAHLYITQYSNVLVFPPEISLQHQKSTYRNSGETWEREETRMRIALEKSAMSAIWKLGKGTGFQPLWELQKQG